MAWGHAAAGGGDGQEWNAVAPRRAHVWRGLLEVRAAAATVAALLGVIAVAIVVKGGGGNGLAVSLEQADVGLIGQEAVTSNSMAPALSVAASAPAGAAAGHAAAGAAASIAAPPVVSTLDEAPAGDAAKDETKKEVDLTREIKELEQQEKKHFAARQKALQAAMQATSACAPTDTACQEAAKHVNWKMSKDQYEQAAMQDIMKEEKEKADKEKESNTAGMMMFKSYSKLADALSGAPLYNQLFNETTNAEHKRTEVEHKALKELQTAGDELRRLEEAKTKLRHEEQEKKQLAADVATQKSMQQEVEKLTSTQSDSDKLFDEAKKQDAERQEREKSRLDQFRSDPAAAHTDPAQNGVPNPAEIKYIDADPYSADLAAATKGELARREAFKQYVAKLHQEDMTAREERQKALAAKEQSDMASGEKKETAVADHMQQSAAMESSSSDYARDVQQALQTDAVRQKEEREAITTEKAAQAKRAQDRQAASDAEVERDTQRAAAISSTVLSRPDVTSSTDFESNLAALKKAEVKKAELGAQQFSQYREARAKVLATDDASRLSKLQSYMESTANAIVGLTEPSPVKVEPPKVVAKPVQRTISQIMSEVAKLPDDK